MGTRPVYGPISSFSRVQILYQLQQNARSTVADLCEVTKLHPNTVREHLQRLMDGGYVIAEVENRKTRGRPRMFYTAVTGDESTANQVATNKVAAAAARGDALRKLFPDTCHELDTIAEHQLDALVEHLEESGFDPILDERSLTLDLTPCPHAAANPDNRETLCNVHLGLMQSVLGTAGGPLEALEVITTERPQDCVVRLVLHKHAEAKAAREAADAAGQVTRGVA